MNKFIAVLFFGLIFSTPYASAQASGEIKRIPWSLSSKGVQYIEMSCDMPQLKVGSRGNSVKWLQAYLKGRWGYKGKIDGIYNEGTVAAVKNFQKSRKLKQTGLVNKKTAEKVSEKIRWFHQKECSKKYKEHPGNETIILSDEAIRRVKFIQMSLELYFADTNGYPTGDQVILGAPGATKLSQGLGFSDETAGSVYVPLILGDPQPGGDGFVYTSLNKKANSKCSIGPCAWYNIIFSSDPSSVYRKIATPAGIINY